MYVGFRELLWGPCTQALPIMENPLRVIGGYIGVLGDYIGVYRTRIMGF